MVSTFVYSKKYNDFLESIGYGRFPNDLMMPQNAKLTIYGYPDNLDYPFVRKLGWFNIEVFNKDIQPNNNRIELEKFVPKEFLDNDLNGKFSGKLIYISLGSMGSIDLELMNRLVNVLAQTNHKYIVSKGPRHSEYSLAPNMWGDRYLPQTKIVPHVDLVITHGGNNTVTETFAQGRAMILLPIFGDQFDNGTRLQETGYGVKLDTYKFKDEQLINAIDSLLNDTELHQKLVKISQRILTSNRHEELADKIEQLLN